MEGSKKKRVHRFHFTRQPGDDVAIVAADFVYNIRSGLDHLAPALVPPAHRTSVMFPIFFQGVWDDPVDGENEQRLKERKRWRTTTRHMHPDARAGRRN